MEISKTDKNFATGEAVISRGTKEVVLPSDNIGLKGIKYNEENGFFGQMDYEIAEKVSYNVKVLSTNTAGGRARFFICRLSINISQRWQICPFREAVGFFDRRNGQCSEAFSVVQPENFRRNGFYRRNAA